jgi:hypothetical protein
MFLKQLVPNLFKVRTFRIFFIFNQKTYNLITFLVLNTDILFIIGQLQ